MRVSAASFIICVLLCSVFAAAAPPSFVQTSEQPGELSVVWPKLTAYQAGVPAVFYVHVFNGTGAPVTNATTNCTFHMYESNGSHAFKSIMEWDETEWEVELNASYMSRVGEHQYIVYCEQGSVGGFASGYLWVTLDGMDDSGMDLWPIAVIILLPLLVSFLLVFGAGLFDQEEHPMLRVGMFFAAIIFTFGSLWYAGMSLVKFYNWQDGVSAMSTLVYVIAALLAFLILYWFLYVVVKVIEAVKEKKEAGY